MRVYTLMDYSYGIDLRLSREGRVTRHLVHLSELEQDIVPQSLGE